MQKIIIGNLKNNSISNDYLDKLRDIKTNNEVIIFPNKNDIDKYEYNNIKYGSQNDIDK